VALDYNSPLLTLAAAHIMNDTSDPYYVQLQDGAYAARRPKGTPCDASTSCNPNSPHFPVVGQIIVGVVVGVLGLVVVGLSIAWVLFCVRGRKSKV
jgi:endoglucanase